MSELNRIALKIISSGKGILAADESNGTMTKRLESVNVKPYKFDNGEIVKTDLMFNRSGS